MIRFILSLLTLSVFVFQGCTDDTINDNQGGNGNDTWLIPFDQVLDGGPGKDGIPSLQNPEFINAGEATYLEDDDLVLGFIDGEDIRAYPHPILDWHEIVNDDFDNLSLAVIYCPLTGTGIGWDRFVNETKTTFGVSGLLYNANVIPYDRETDSNWSQLLLKSVNGQLTGTPTHSYNLLETTWGTWKNSYPSTKVLSTNTGYNRNYNRYPYGTYKTNNDLIFPVNNTDDRLHKKERVLALIHEESVRAYRFESFESSLSLIYDEFLTEKLVIVGSDNLNFMVAFHRELADGTLLEFESVQDELPVILSDQEGNRWDAFGRAISGPREGEHLQQLTQMMGYWFSFAAFYPGISIYDF